MAVQVLIKAKGQTLNQLSCVTWVSLHRCLLIMPLAFSTSSEDWGLLEQCKWYSIPRIFWQLLSYSSFKDGALLLWTLEFKIPLTSWEVSTVKFHPLVNFWALFISKTIVTITLKPCGHSLFFFLSNKLWSCGQAQSDSLQESSLKRLKSLLSL